MEGNVLDVIYVHDQSVVNRIFAQMKNQGHEVEVKDASITTEIGTEKVKKIIIYRK